MEFGLYPSSVEVLWLYWLRAYPSVERWCLREEFGTPLLYKSSSVEVPSVGDSGLEIFHGGEGGDVELGARTSKHILLLAFDPLSLNSFSLLIVQSIIHFTSFILLVLCLALFILLYLLYAWIVCVCLTCT